MGIFLFFLWGVFGCVIPITKKDKSWIPYTKGETIFFRSSEGKLDSIYIENIRTITPKGITGFFKPQWINVIESRNDSIITAIHHKKVVRQTQSTLFSVTTGIPLIEEQKISIGIKNFGFNGKVSELESRRLDSIELQGKNFMNVFMLEEYPKFYTIKDSTDIEKVYWDKEVGLIGFIQYDGILWLKH